jgi:hypothetical protein
MIDPKFYSSDVCMVRSIDLSTGNYVYEGPFDHVVDGANYITRHWASIAVSEEPTLIMVHKPKPDITDEEEDEPFPNLEY